MKKICLLALVIITMLCSTQTKALDASISYATFKSADFSFLEVYLNLMGPTLGYKELDSISFQASVEVLILIRKDTNIVKFDKYVLNGPVTKFTNDFVDVKRFALEPGDYTLEVSLADLNQDDNNAIYEKSFTIDYRKEGILQSDIQLLTDFRQETGNSPFIKNGLFLNPLPYNFYYKDATHLCFYQEVYNSDKVLSDKFLLRYVIEEMKNGKAIPVMLGNKKLDPKSVNVVLVKKDITKLKSGNYQLVVEIRNRAGEVLSTKSIPFQRSNPYLEEEELAKADLTEEFVAGLDSVTIRYSLKAIAPIVNANGVEVLNMVISNKDLAAQRRYLFSFWGRMEPNNSKGAYEKYMEVARAVDKKYNSAFGYGFESDRGFVFMKYGKPTDIVSVENEPSAPPYEIWIYDQVPTSPPQGNVKFLFYNPSLAGGNYQLLHSTCIGERQNPAWEVDLYRDDNNAMNGVDLDSERVGGGFNRRAREYFSDF